MKSSEPNVYDVLIMGAGFAGLCQARHLMLKIPGIRVGLIDPKGPGATNRQLKVGESLVEISAMFLYKELELHEYLIENHAPKFGLNFHWPKKVGKTETVDDYFHIWTNGSPDLPSYQLNRAKFETDLLAMCIEMGVDFIEGKVTDTEIGKGTELNSAFVRTPDGEQQFRTHHLIDAAGRKFLLGKKLDNLITDPERLAGLETGSAWLRVDGVDRKIFEDKRDPTNGSASHYYGTNHWFGHGHWIWMIPIETRSRALSIGVVHHKSIIESRDVNSREKFLAFLKANHRVLFNLIESGEIIDFKYLPVISHASKEMLSEDQWYVIGEAANMFDPFYSTGLVLAAQNIECVTEVIREKRMGDPLAEDRRALYNEYILQASRVYNQVYQRHAEHLGDANAMSWRIYLESIFWFGILVPMFAGKWHLETDFIGQFFKLTRTFFHGRNSIVGTFYEELSSAQESGKCLGMMNYTRTDQMPFGYNPLKLWDDFRQNSKYEKRRLNALKGIRMSIFYIGVLYAKLRIRHVGVHGLLEPRSIRVLSRLTGWFVYTTIGEWIHKWEVRGRPGHTRYREQEEEFAAHYLREPRLMPWKGKELAQEEGVMEVSANNPESANVSVATRG